MRRNEGLVGLVLVMTACSQRSSSAPTAPMSSTRPADAPSPAPVTTESTAAPLVESEKASPKPLDTSDWKSAAPGSTIHVRWTVDQTKAVPKLGTSGSDLTRYKVPLVLDLTVDGRSHSIALETDGASAYSDSCALVSFFYAGINIAFKLQQVDDRRVSLEHTVTVEGSSPDWRDKNEVLAVFDAPTGAKFDQEIVTIGADGKRTVAACTAKKTAGPPPGVFYWRDGTMSIPGTLVRKQTEYSGGVEVPIVVFDMQIRIQNKPGTDTAPPLLAREAWLSYNGIDKAAVNKLVGKKVLYRGALEPMQTGHHLTNPWLDGVVTPR